MKRITLYLMCVTLTILSLYSFSGCSKNDFEDLDEKLKQSQQTIEVWTYYNDSQWNAFNVLVSQFNSTVGKEFKMLIKPHNFGGIPDLTKAIRESSEGTAVGVKEMPDMFLMYADDCLNQDMEFNNVASMDKYFTADELNEFVPQFLEEGRYDENRNLKIIPIAKSTEVMMLNKTDFDAFLTEWNSANPNDKLSYDLLSTYEGLIKISEKYFSMTGKAFFGRDSMPNYMISSLEALSTNVVTIGKDKKATLNMNKSDMRLIFDNYFVPYVSDYFVHSGKFRSDDIKTGKILASVCSSTGMEYFPENIHVSDTGIKSIEAYVSNPPTFNGKKKVAIQQGAGMVVTKSDEITEYACAKFLKWFIKEEHAIAFSGTSGYVPVTKKALDTELLTASVDNQMFKDVMTIAANNLKNSEYKNHFPAPYIGSAKVRKIFDNCIVGDVNFIGMPEFINANVAKDMIKNGEATLDYFKSDAFFDSWYQNMITLLEKAIA